MPDSWKLKEIFATGVVLGSYMALMTVVFFWLIKDTDFFPVIIYISGFSQYYHLLEKMVRVKSAATHAIAIAGQIWCQVHQK